MPVAKVAILPHTFLKGLLQLGLADFPKLKYRLVHVGLHDLEACRSREKPKVTLPHA